MDNIGALWNKRKNEKRGVLASDTSNKIVQHKPSCSWRRQKGRWMMPALPWSLLGLLLCWKETLCTASPLSPPNPYAHTHRHMHPPKESKETQRTLRSAFFLENLFALETAGWVKVIVFWTRGIYDVYNGNRSEKGGGKGKELCVWGGKRQVLKDIP